MDIYESGLGSLPLFNRDRQEQLYEGHVSNVTPFCNNWIQEQVTLSAKIVSQHPNRVDRQEAEEFEESDNPELDSGPITLHLPFTNDPVELSSSCGALWNRWQDPEKYYDSGLFSHKLRIPKTEAKKRPHATAPPHGREASGQRPSVKEEVKKAAPHVITSQSRKIQSSQSSQIFSQSSSAISAPSASAAGASQSQRSMLSSRTQKKSRKKGF